MLHENIQSIRKSKGLSQEELAIKLHVVRQTVSKWERGLSVPDSEMLIRISEILETPVSVLLGETNPETEVPVDDLKVISEKLELINLQLARSKAAKRKVVHGLFIALCALIVVIAAVLILQSSPYLHWDFNDPETAVAGTFFHAFEWLFFRVAPIAFIGAVVGVVLTRQRE
uniref:helix-turn-helix domain-containing protein n=1 Tax=Ndongobacter massiliensis TaxID=1871025 RepID=UPI0009318834|nr:helix-turn-helix transcriptional regulator [Ndongobacter massiliensis]